MKDILVSLPGFGKYTGLVVEAFKDAGFKVVAPPQVTKKTIELGTRYAPSESCLPLKITLGTMIELLDKKVDILLMFSIASWCVIRCYWSVQKQILEDLGYNFQAVVLNPYKPFLSWRNLKKINRKLSFLKAARLLIRAFKQARELDREEKEVNKGSPVKIALLGEVYVTNEDTINMGVVRRLQELGCYVDRWLSLSGYAGLFFKQIFRVKDLRKYRKLARQYFPERIAGHANENIVRMIKYASEGFDGIICLKPMFCKPEGVCEKIFDKISENFGIPVLQLSLDEFNQRARFYDRIDAFVESIKLGKGL